MSLFDLRPIHGIDIASDKSLISLFIHSENIKNRPQISINLHSLYLFNSELFFKVILSADTYLDIFYEILDDIFYNQNEIIYNENKNGNLMPNNSVFNNYFTGHNCSTVSNVFMYHRISRAKEKFPSKRLTELFPGDLLREYCIVFEYEKMEIKRLISSLNMESSARNGNTNNYLFNNTHNNTNNNMFNNTTNSLFNNTINNTNNNMFNTPFFVKFVPLRFLRSDLLSSFIFTRGIITKTSPPSPIITTASYICDSCGSESYLKVENSFNHIKQCFSDKCKLLKIRPTLSLQIKASKFHSVVECYLSECLIDVPSCFSPKVIKLLTQKVVKVGDFVYVTGILKFKDGFYVDVHKIYNENELEDASIDNELMCAANLVNKEAINSDNEPISVFNELISSTNSANNEPISSNEVVINSSLITNELIKNNPNDIILTSPSVQNIPMAQNSIYLFNNIFTLPLPDSFTNLLIKSFAPEIYGLSLIKKTLLLTTIGSITKHKTFLKIRGQINTLLIGDPGTAKSQLLKSIQKITKCIYTTGCGSSSTGLTASVMKYDNNFVLEAGALALSDNGICLIDELDKMDIKNRVCIHETMEQQSISISKAGINCELNARVAIIAACNPIKGFYDSKWSVERNSGLQLSLLSRFDCVCVLKDEFDEERDCELGKHVTRQYEYKNEREYVETNINSNENNKNNLLSYDQIYEFIEKAKKLKPTIPKYLSKKILKKYLEKRKLKKETTPRLLLSLIRMSIANCKMRLSEVVNEEDVEESIKILEMNDKKEEEEVNEEKFIDAGRKITIE